MLSSQVSTSSPARPVAFDTAIIGTGFGGLCMAIKLKQQGQDNFVLLERADDVGGTWRDNQYPGAACDVPSHLYSLSFEPNPYWTRKFPSQTELWSYLRSVARKHDLYRRIRFRCIVQSATWNDQRQHWLVETSSGPIVAAKLVCANGALADPKLPDIPGLAGFRGYSFHSSRWDANYDLSGKRVAVIGTGASAIQFVPEIADKVSSLDVYQRTPNWILPRPDRQYGAIETFLFKWMPLARLIHRYAIFWALEARILGMVIFPAILKTMEAVAKKHIQSQLKDEDLRRKVTPAFPIGCKRVLISNNWYPALSRSNVTVITDGIREVREHAIVSASGEERTVDCIIFATGFYATENPIASIIVGERGKTLSQAWEQGEEAYRGVLVKGFPNLFFIVGPNTILGHSSMVFMIETQVRYICRLFGLMSRRRSRVLQVQASVQDDYNRRLQMRLGNSIWASGCNSWYKHASGKITALWPSFCFTFALMLRRLRLSDYSLAPAKGPGCAREVSGEADNRGRVQSNA